MEPTGFSIGIYTPLSQGGRFLYRVQQPVSYTHTHQANGGFWSASFTLEGEPKGLEDWLNNGLGRHIVIYGDALTIIWEGFVNEITIPYSNLTIGIGPFMDIANRIRAYYSTIDTSVLPPTIGYRALTPTANNAASQALYGIQEKVLTLGSTNSTNAAIVRDAYLDSLAYPAISKSWATGSPNPLHIELKCLGYVHWLNNYVYNQTTTTGTAPTSTKILSILAASPNSAIVPFDTSHIETPAAPANVCVYEDDSIPAWTLIQDCVVQADGATPPNRWLFGVYENRSACYSQAPTEVEYIQRLSDPAQRVVTSGGAVVRPWAVRSGKWLRFPDLLFGTTQYDLAQDKGAMFLETVTYTAPDQLQLTEGQTGDIAQLLNQLGLGGGSY